ncbi:hypothetical protein KC660_00060, partial [Candidatus Dojkabacteria bacterium]|nr:hypothetical protein [Candidatus Dojkabacteria bacterium]
SLESIAEPGCPRLKFIKNRFEESTNRSPLLYTLGCLLKLNMLESQRKNGGIRAINWFRAAGIVLSAPFFLTGDNVQVKYTHFNNQTGATEEGYRTRHNDRGTLR